MLLRQLLSRRRRLNKVVKAYKLLFDVNSYANQEDAYEFLNGVKGLDDLSAAVLKEVSRAIDIQAEDKYKDEVNEITTHNTLRVA